MRGFRDGSAVKTPLPEMKLGFISSIHMVGSLQLSLLPVLEDQASSGLSGLQIIKWYTDRCVGQTSKHVRENNR